MRFEGMNRFVAIEAFESTISREVSSTDLSLPSASLRLLEHKSSSTCLIFNTPSLIGSYVFDQNWCCKLDFAEWFGQCISKHELSSAVHELDFSRLDSLTGEVIPNFDMPCSSLTISFFLQQALRCHHSQFLVSGIVFFATQWLFRRHKAPCSLFLALYT